MANFITGLLDAYKNEGKKPMRSEGPALSLAQSKQPVVGRAMQDPSAPIPNEQLEPEDMMEALPAATGRDVAQSYFTGGGGMGSDLFNKAEMARYMNVLGSGNTSSRRRGFLDADGGVSQRENTASVMDYVKSLPEYMQFQNETKQAEDQLARLKTQESPRAMSEVGPLLAFVDSLTGSNLMAGYDKNSPAKEYSDKLKSLTDLVSNRKKEMFSTLLGAPKDLLLDTDVVRTDNKTTNLNQNTANNTVKDSKADQKLDEDFAKQYTYYLGGGAQAYENSKASLSDAISVLDNTEDIISGKVDGNVKNVLNTWVQRGVDIANPRNINNQITRVVSQEVLPQLRELFGAQFTEKENTAFVRLMNDTGLTPKQRAAGVRQIISRLESKYNSFIKKKEYTDQNMGAMGGRRTLRGFVEDINTAPGISGLVDPNSGAATVKKKPSFMKKAGE